MRVSSIQSAICWARRNRSPCRARKMAAGPFAGALKNWSCLRHGIPPPSSGTQAVMNCSVSVSSALGRSTPAIRPARSSASANQAMSS